MTDPAEVRFLDRTTPPHIATLILIAGLGALTMSIFLPSLAAMAVYFDTSYAVMQLSVSGYLAVNAVLQLIIGPVSDRFGRRPVMLTALVLFVFATIGTLLAPTAGVFLFFRLMQSVIVTGLVLSRAIVRDMVPQEQAASMIGYVTMGMALVPMIGPIIGGVLEQLFGWRASFAVLALCGIAIFALCWKDQGETARPAEGGFRAQFAAWPELLTSRRFWGYTLVLAFSSGAFFAFLGGASYVADEVFGLSPAMAGVGFGAPAIGYAIGNGLSGRYSVRVGTDRMVMAGAIVATGGMGTSLLLSLAGVGGPLTFFFFCTFLGIGNGLTIPNATAGALSVKPELAGTASGLSGSFMIGGGAALSVLAGLVLQDAGSAVPLKVLMFSTSAAAIVTMIWVLRRKAVLTRLEAEPGRDAPPAG